MRKTSIFVLIALIGVLLIGCSQQADQTGMDESFASPSSFSAGESTETPAPSEEPTESAHPDETIPPAESDQATTTPAASNTKPPVVDQTDNSKPPTSSQPTQSQPPTATSTPTEQPTTESKPTEPPATSTPVPVFDPQPYVDYAVSYGKSIGLKYEPAIGTGAWNSPVNLYATLSEENMKLGIRSSCDVLISEGFEYFWVSAVKQSGDSYQLFVYYG